MTEAPPGATNQAKDKSGETPCASGVYTGRVGAGLRNALSRPCFRLWAVGVSCLACLYQHSLSWNAILRGHAVLLQERRTRAAASANSIKKPTLCIMPLEHFLDE